MYTEKHIRTITTIFRKADFKITHDIIFLLRLCEDHVSYWQFALYSHSCIRNSFVKDNLFFKSVYEIFAFVHELFATLKSKSYSLIQFSKCMASNILNHANHISSNTKHTKTSTKNTEQVNCFWQSRMIKSFYRLQLCNVKYSKSEELLTGLQKSSQSIRGKNNRKIN